jgi:hypothetical protein
MKGKGTTGGNSNKGTGLYKGVKPKSDNSAGEGNGSRTAKTKTTGCGWIIIRGRRILAGAV